MKNRLASLFACSLIVAVPLASCGGGSGGAGQAPSPAPAPPSPSPSPSPALSGPLTLSRTVLETGRGIVWDIAFAPDQTMFFTERGGGLSVRLTNGTVRRLFGVGGAAVAAPDFIAEGQSGFNGVAVDPEFATNRRVYVYMSSNAGGTKNNRVVRLTVDNAYTTVSNRTDIVTGITFKSTPAPGAPAGSGAHNGGRIRFGPDNFLYITTGDTHSPTVPQSPTELGGKVLRVDRDGNPAPGNNPPAGFDRRIYAYGFRNPQGIAFRPGTGEPFTAEHGPGHSDEVTRLTAGGNAGWDPVCLDGVSYCGYGSNQTNGAPTPMTDLVKFPHAMRPSWNNNGASEGTGPATFLSGAQWKDWNGRLAVGIMGGQRLMILQLDASGATVGAINAGLPSVRFRALTQGPDGNLYIGTDSGQIWRVVPN